MARTIKATRENLNGIMEFDHVIEVHADGTVTEPDGVYAPDLNYGELGSREKWTLLTGYTGQHGYNGPIMHQSETISGNLARDILDTPGLYVAVVDYPDVDNEPTGWAVARRDA